MPEPRRLFRGAKDALAALEELCLGAEEELEMVVRPEPECRLSSYPQAGMALSLEEGEGLAGKTNPEAAVAHESSGPTRGRGAAMPLGRPVLFHREPPRPSDGSAYWFGLLAERSSSAECRPARWPAWRRRQAACFSRVQPCSDREEPVGTRLRCLPEARALGMAKGAEMPHRWRPWARPQLPEA